MTINLFAPPNISLEDSVCDPQTLVPYHWKAETLSFLHVFNLLDFGVNWSFTREI